VGGAAADAVGLRRVGAAVGDALEQVAAFRERRAVVYPEEALPLVVESAGGGRVAAQELTAACGFSVIEVTVKGSTKVARQEAVSPLAEAGQVWLPSPARAPWVREWVTELIGFPHLAHDDRCDAAAMALLRLKQRRGERFVRWLRGSRSDRR
jgi:predicted phage terminase large subunit-like protein